MKLKFAFLCSLGLAATNALACFTVYDPSNRVVYNGQTPPVDMSLPLHQTLPQVYPGGHLVFNGNMECSRVQIVESRSPDASPLLTDRRTAQALKLPHTILPTGAVLVSQPPENMRPGVSVASSTALPAVIVPARSRSTVVITEMRDPPMTVVQMGANMMVRELR